MSQRDGVEISKTKVKRNDKQKKNKKKNNSITQVSKKGGGGTNIDQNANANRYQK